MRNIFRIYRAPYQIAQRIQQPEYYQSKKDLLSQLLFSEVGKTLSEQELVDEMKREFQTLTDGI